MFEWYWIFVFYLIAIHIKSVVMTIYLHRGISHGSVEISRPLDEVFKFLTWTFGMYSDNYKKEYRAGHLKHHIYSDTVNDPHSPHQFSFKQIVFPNPKTPTDPYFLSDEDVVKYSKNIKVHTTWFDVNVYRPYQKNGIWVWHFLNFILLGPIGGFISILTLKFALHNFLQFLNPYLMHKVGYRSKEGKIAPNDKSRNISPIGILLGGEELHSNHHNFISDAKFSKKWYEFDIGWFYIKILTYLKLVTVTKDRFRSVNKNNQTG
jgi:stearoyl-CoA desaturase (delta-9 desaturase)